MISFASSAATTSFLGPKLRSATTVSEAPQHRPMRVSASFASSSTVERPRGSRVGSDSLYEVLGIRMEATCQEIKSAYRRLARVVHPDVAAKGKASPSAADEFMKIHEAYSTLSDPDKRADYDRALFGRHWIDATMRSGDSYANAMSSYGSAFYGTYARPTGRTWETDQCW